MFYFKRNLPGFERLARLAIAFCLASIAHAYQPVGWLAITVYAVAALIACTAIAGFCPACALAGRKTLPPSA